MDSCQRFINQIHHKYIEPTYQNNFIRLAIVNQDFAPINIGFTKASSVTPKFIFDHIDQVVQSRKKSMETEKTSMYNLKFSIFIANVIRGGSKTAKKSKTQKDTRLGINKFGKLIGKRKFAKK